MLTCAAVALEAPVPFEPALLGPLPIALEHLGSSTDSALLQNGCELATVVLDRSPEQVSPLLEPLGGALLRLLGPDLDDNAALYVGPVITKLVMQVRPLPPVFIIEVLRVIVARCATAQLPSLQQALLGTMGRLLHLDCGQVLTVLANQQVPLEGKMASGLDVLLGMWCAHAHKVISRVQRNVAFSALTLLVDAAGDEPLASVRTRVPIRQRLVEVLVEALQREVEREQERTNASEKAARAAALAEDEDDELGDEFGDLGGPTAFGDADEFLSVLQALGEGDDDGDDGSDSEDEAELAAHQAKMAAKDPLYALQLLPHLTAQLEHWDTQEPWAAQLPAELRVKLQAVVGAAKRTFG